MPKECGEDDIKALFLQSNKNNNVTNISGFKINCLPTHKSWTAGPIIMVTLASLLGLMGIIGTSWDVIRRYRHLFSAIASAPLQQKGEYQFLSLEEGADAGDDEMHTLVNPGVIDMEETVCIYFLFCLSSLLSLSSSFVSLSLLLMRLFIRTLRRRNSRRRAWCTTQCARLYLLSRSKWRR